MSLLRRVLPKRQLGNRASSARYFAAFLSIGLSFAAAAIDRVSIDIGDIQGGSWQAKSVSVVLSGALSTPDVVLAVGQLHIGESKAGFNLTRVRFRCDSSMTLNSDRLACRRARLSAAVPNKSDTANAAGRPLSISGEGSFDIDLKSGIAELDFPALSLGTNENRSTAAIALKQSGERWWITANVPKITAKTLEPLLAFSGQQAPMVFGAGDLSLWVQASGLGAVVTSGTLKTKAKTLAVANASSTVASEQLTGDVEFKWANRGRTMEGPWAISGSANFAGGYAGVDPVYADFTEYPTTLTFAAYGEQRAAAPQEKSVSGWHWAFSQFEVKQGSKNGQLLSVEGPFSFSFSLPAAESAVDAAPKAKQKDEQKAGAKVGSATDSSAGFKLISANLRWSSDSFDKLFPAYIQPLLVSTSFSRATLTGSGSGELTLENEQLTAISVSLSDVNMDNGSGQYSISDLAGSLAWAAGAEAVRSELRWSAASLYKLPVGATVLPLVSKGGELALAQSTAIPLLDGALRFNDFAINPGAEQALSLDAVLEPIQLEQLTAALGWPSFGGSLSGHIPKVSYKGQKLSVNGVMEAKVFNGTMAVEGLQIADLFGRLPKLRAGLTMRNLDLEKITDAFDIGRITGGLNVDVEKMLLVGWQPAAFDARIYTPKRDPLPHRLSQRALDNIADIGGAGAALSAPLVRFFKNFRYDRIELRCKLFGDVCNMAGVPAGEGGYYLVKGSGLPRVDVIGHTKRVDWPRLVEQISKAIERGGVSTEGQ